MSTVPNPTRSVVRGPGLAPPAAARAARKLRRTVAALTLAGLIAGGSLGGCAPRVTSTVYRTLPPKASAAEVQVFTDGRPSRAYEELGLIEVSRYGRANYGRLIERARAEAARMGADAILVTRENRVVSTTTSGTVNPPRRDGGRTVTTSSSTLEQPRVTVTAIVWSGR